MPRPSKAELEQRERERQEEIQAEADRRIQGMIPGIIAGVVAQLNSHPGGQVAGGQALDFESLATAMVRASNPKNRTTAVDPGVLKKRKEHYQRMVELIEQAKANGDRPIYKMRGKSFLNHQKIDPQWRDSATKQVKDTEIFWDRVPNEAMIPANDVAKRIHAEYQGWIGKAISREGMPAAPWLTGAAPWIHSKEGIIRGKEPAIAEVGEPLDETMADPRITGRPEKSEGTRILGSLHPPLVETPGFN